MGHASRLGAFIPTSVRVPDTWIYVIEAVYFIFVLVRTAPHSPTQPHMLPATRTCASGTARIATPGFLLTLAPCDAPPQVCPIAHLAVLLMLWVVPMTLRTQSRWYVLIADIPALSRGGAC